MCQRIFESDGFCDGCGAKLRVFIRGEDNPGLDEADLVRPCPKCFPGRYESWNRRRELFKKPKRVAQLLKASKLTPLFLGKTFENFEIYDRRQEEVVKECRSFAENFPARQDRGNSLLLMGPPGTGKGHLAASIIHRIVELHEATALFEKYIYLKERIQRSWKPESEETEEQVKESVRGTDLLFLDEIGVQFRTPFEQLILYEIIDYRVEYKKPTILSTNLDLKELSRVVGARVYDRLLNQESENKVLAFTWPSHRRTGGVKLNAG